MIPSASESSIWLDIVQFDRHLYSGPVSRFSVRTASGEVGILPRHAPLMALLLPCVARIQDSMDGSPKLIYIGGGFMEVQPDNITVLAEVAEWGHEVDVQSARKQREEAENIMMTAALIQERDRAQLTWMQATARLELWEKTNHP